MSTDTDDVIARLRAFSGEGWKLGDDTIALIARLTAENARLLAAQEKKLEAYAASVFMDCVGCGALIDARTDRLGEDYSRDEDGNERCHVCAPDELAAAQSAPSGLDGQALPEWFVTESKAPPGWECIDRGRGKFMRVEGLNDLAGAWAEYRDDASMEVAAATARLTAEVAALRERVETNGRERDEARRNHAWLSAWSRGPYSRTLSEVTVDECRDSIIALYDESTADRVFPRGPAAVKGATTDAP